MEEAIENLEKQMKKTDEKMDDLTFKVVNIENEIFKEPDSNVQVVGLLHSISEVNQTYQNLKKEITEVQEMQKELSTTLQVQLRNMQSKFNQLKEKLNANMTKSTENLAINKGASKQTY